MRGLSRFELTHLRDLMSSAPLPLPHRFLGGRKWEGARAESLSEKKAICLHREMRIISLQ